MGNRMSSRSFKADRWSWFIFLLLVALGGPITYAYYHRRILTEAPALPPESGEFRLAVLEYRRLDPEGRLPHSLSAAALKSHIQALKRAGLEPVSAAQVTAAYRSGKPLPKRSVLFTFDGGYMSSYEAAHSVLSQTQTPGLMFLDTGRQAARDNHFLYWDRLQLMLDSGLWGLGVHGHRPIQADGSPGPQPSSGLQAYLQSRELISAHLKDLKTPPFAPLSGIAPGLPDGFQGEAEAPPLAFSTDPFGINTPESHPLRLRRLKVNPAWTPEDLLMRLRQAMEDIPTSGELAPGQWRLEADDPAGVVRDASGAIRLEGDSKRGLWLSGSRYERDFIFSAQIKVDSGEFWVVQEGEGGRRWRVGSVVKPGCQDPVLYVQDQKPHEKPLNLARVKRTSPLTGVHDLKIIRRGPGLWVEWDGQALTPHPLYLKDFSRGDLGILCAPLQGMAFRMEITHSRLERLSGDVATVSADPLEDEIQALHSRMRTLSTLSPRWKEQRGHQLQGLTLNLDLLRMMQKRYALHLIPILQVRDLASPQLQSQILACAREARSLGLDGLRLDLGGCPAHQRQDGKAALQDLQKGVSSLGLHLKIDAPPIGPTPTRHMKP